MRFVDGGEIFVIRKFEFVVTLLYCVQIELQLNPADLKVETFRSGGCGKCCCLCTVLSFCLRVLSVWLFCHVYWPSLAAVCLQQVSVYLADCLFSYPCIIKSNCPPIQLYLLCLLACLSVPSSIRPSHILYLLLGGSTSQSCSYLLSELEVSM